MRKARAVSIDAGMRARAERAAAQAAHAGIIGHEPTWGSAPEAPHMRSDRVALPLIVFACPALALAGGQLAPLADLPGGAVLTRAAGLSRNGGWVVGQSSGASGLVAARWSAATGEVMALGSLGGPSPKATARGVSDDGAVVCGDSSTPAGITGAFRWVEGIGIAPLPKLAAFQENASANAISADGSIIVGSNNGFEFFEAQAVRWVDGAVESLGDPPGGDVFSIALATSATGDVSVGFGSSGDGQPALLWFGNGAPEPVGAGDLDGARLAAQANWVSSDGVWIAGGGTSSEGSEAFLWSGFTGFIGLGDLPGGGSFSEATAAMLDGSVVFGRTDTDDGFQAFAWSSEGGMVLLAEWLAARGVSGIEGWTFESVAGVSDDGLTIAGTGASPEGDTRAWVVRLDAPRGPVGINIDHGTGAGDPRSTYGAASEQAGHWNIVQGGGFDDAKLLSDVGGDPTGVVLRQSLPFGAAQFDHPGTEGPDARLLDDYLDLNSTPSTFTLSGLPAGAYEVFVYAWAPDQPSLVTAVTIGEESVLVSGAWPGGFAEGTTHARFDVEVASGEDLVVSMFGFISGTLNGMQIVPARPRVCSGDADGDGVTDSADLNAVLASFGCATACGDADVSGDGAVDSIDLNAVLGAFGCGAG